MSKGTFGDCLKREREMREVTLEEICAATRIGTRFLEAMENEEWEKLPGGVFNRGFVRSVARYLGLDEETMLAEYDLARSHSAAGTIAQPAQSIPRSFPKWLVFFFVLILAALIAAGVFGWHLFAPRHAARDKTASGSTPDRTSSPATTAAPSFIPEDSSQRDVKSAQTPATPSSGQSPSASIPASPPRSTSATPVSNEPGVEVPLQLSIAAGKNTQLQVLADGKTLYDTAIHAGESQHFQAREAFNVSVGDSGGVLLELNGQAMPPLGTPGSPGKITLTRKDLKKANRGSN